MCFHQESLEYQENEGIRERTSREDGERRVCKTKENGKEADGINAAYVRGKHLSI